MAHIGLHYGKPVISDDLVQLFHTLGVGCGLRLQICDILGGIAGRVAASCEELKHGLFAESARLNELERVDIDAFLVDMRGLWAHGAWRNAADIGVVAARGHEEENLATFR